MAEAVEAARAPAGGASASFRTLSVHEARALVLYGIERRYPVQVVVGRSGTGKSHLLAALARTHGAGADVVLLRTVPTSFDVTTRLLARHLDVVDVAGESALERLARVADALAERRRSGRLVALLIDDAHLLDNGTLADIRLLAGTDSSGGALLPIVLAGRPEFAGRLEEPALEPLRLAVSLRVELSRPLPAAAADATPGSAGARPATPPPSRWAMPALLPTVGVILGALVLHPELASHRHGRGAGPQLVVAAVQPSPARQERPDAAVPRLGMTPAPIPDRLDPSTLRGPLTAGRVRRVVEEFGRALADRDLAMLETLLARDARQNGLRGRTPILDAYAYRFSRLDAPTTIGAPSRIVLADGSARVDAPFTTSYRDAGGETGAVDGMLHLRVTRHRDRLVLDAVDYDFTPGDR